jgi:hypothetical protein
LDPSDRHGTVGFDLRRPFPLEIDPEWPGKNVVVNLDVGLIDLDDTHD